MEMSRSNANASTGYKIRMPVVLLYTFGFSLENMLQKTFVGVTL